MSQPKPKPPRERAKLPHDTPAWVREGAIFFVTVCCQVRGVNHLCRRSTAKVLFETVEFRQRRGDWFVHLFLLMPDHVHVLISFPRDRSMRRVVSNWKEIVAKNTGVAWQRDFFDHRLRNDHSYAEKAHYIRMNPVRKGLIVETAQWPFLWEPSAEPSGGPSGPALPSIHISPERSGAPAIDIVAG